MRSNINWWEYGPVLNQENLNPPPEPLDSDKILDALNEPDEIKDDDKINLNDKDDKDDKLDEEEELEDKEEKPEEKDENSDEGEDEELEALTGSFSRKALLKAYPKIFKEFPQLERGYYASLKYREIFPDLDDAQEAQTKAETLDKYQEELGNGSSEGLFKALKEDNPGKFAKVVDNYLPNLLKVDSDAYYHVIGNVIKRTVMSMVDVAERKKNDDLLTAAKMVKEFVWGEEDFVPPQAFSKGKNPDKDEISEERKQFQSEQRQAKEDDITERVENTVKNTITEFIDPKKAMSGYIRTKAIEDAEKLVNKALKADREFQSKIKKLWDKAEKSKYSKEALADIKTAHLSKAKTILPTIIRKVRNEALQGLGRRKDTKENEKEERGPLPNNGNRSSSLNRGRSDDKKAIPPGMSSLDYLNSD